MSRQGGEGQYAKLEIGLFRRRDGSHECELRFTNPRSAARINPVREACAFDLTALLEEGTDYSAYGKRLSKMVFGGSGPLHEMFLRARTAVETAEPKLKLRICLYVDKSAVELLSIRWELLTAPDTERPLSTDKNILFSRYMSSDDWTTISRRARGSLRALIAVSAPPDIEAKRNLAPVDGPYWIDQAVKHLAGVEFDIAGRDEPLTFALLGERLRKPIDILYLVCHGEFDPGSGANLLLQNEDGSTADVSGRDLAERIRTLQTRPRLVVLVSCESAGRGEDPIPDAKNDDGVPALATLLAEAGVMAVVAMRGKITMNSMAAAMPEFLKELLVDGQIDRALAAARFQVRENWDFWLPALYSRLEDGRLWYDSGFGLEGTEEFGKWRSILTQVGNGTFLPIIGPNTNEPMYGDVATIAEELAEAESFPLAAHQRGNLAQVAQYILVNQDKAHFETELLDSIRSNAIKRHPTLPEDVRDDIPKIWDTLIQRGSGNYPFLAELNASLYITATQDTLLKRTLEAKQKEPELVVCNWKKEGRRSPPLAPEVENPDPDAMHPLVFHAFGVFGESDSLVLTEDHYFDYMIATAQFELWPKVVISRIVDSAWFFLGFQLTDLSFRVLFRLIRSLEGLRKSLDKTHIGVQVDPNEHDFADVVAAREYFRKYYGSSPDYDDPSPKLEIYWGTANDFLTDLLAKMKKEGVRAPLRPKPAKGRGNVA